MRISHRQLAQCQINPIDWVSNQVNQNENFYRMSYERCLREEINRFHNQRDVKAARGNMQEKFLKHKLTNSSRIQNTITRLNAYMNWFQREGITIIASRRPLDFDLGHGIILGGFISRVDVTPNGYRAILLEEIPLRWDEELRMPLIQRGLARTYCRPEDGFVVGFQELDASNLVETSYSRADINYAEQIVRQLAEVVANELAKK